MTSAHKRVCDLERMWYCLHVSQRATMASRRSSSNIRVAQGFRCLHTCSTLSLPPDVYPPRGVRAWSSTYLKGATQGTALTTDPLRSSRLSTSCLPSSSRTASHVLCACTTSSTRFAPAEERSTLCRTYWQLRGGAPRLTRPRMPPFGSVGFDEASLDAASQPLQLSLSHPALSLSLS